MDDRPAPDSADPCEQLRAAWAAFGEEFAARLEKLHGVWEQAWADVQGLLAEVEASPAPAAAASGGLSALCELFDGAGAGPLRAASGGLTRLKPVERVLQAIEDFHTAGDDLFRHLPAQIPVSGRDLLEVFGAAAAGRWRRHTARFRGRARPLAPRRIAMECWMQERLRRARLEGEFQLLLAQACGLLLEPWEETRLEALHRLSETGADAGKAPRRELRKRRAAALASRARLLLDEHRARCKAAPARLIAAMLRRPPPRSADWPQKRLVRYQGFFAYWSRQQRAIAGQVELEVSLAALVLDAVRAGKSALDSLEREHGDLVAELANAIDWLAANQEGEPECAFPVPPARLMPAAERVDACVKEIAAQARVRLPETLEVIEPRAALPQRRPPWVRLYPQAACIRFLEGTGRTIAIEGFREAEAGHRSIIREIERAREVVAFSLETARADAGTGMEIARQGITNALDLLRYQQRSVSGVRQAGEASLVRGLSEALLEAYIRFDRGRIGLAAHFLRQAGGHGLRTFSSLLAEGGRTVAGQAWRHLRRRQDWLLSFTGLRTPPVLPPAPVIHTARLCEVLDLRLGPHELPAIYHRLFRLAPVEDPRFLVGRDEELAGMAAAYRAWESGAYAAVMVVGARGSGKTSLLNCAGQTVLAEVPVFRGSFQHRIVEPDGVRGFLCRLLDLPRDCDLQAELSRGRRVIVIEELERVFLRRAGGFEAMRYLLRLIQQTAAGSLWMVSLNESAFRYLEAAAGIGQYFTYRVNAMSVLPQDLRAAIFLRHNLSGYRLDFAPPAGGGRMARLRRRLGLEAQPPDLFFDALYRQSEGIFRSAFELWQRYIERVEGGVLYMRQPAGADFGALTGALQADDFFTLQAILQHGALTSAEHAEVFLAPEAASRSCLEKLRSMEILEADPHGDGLRVRPEAGRLVREALHRRNL